MISELISSGAAAVVGAMSTDAWAWVKAEVTRLFGKSGAPADVVGRRLDASKAEIERVGSDAQQVARIEADWRVRLGDLLSDRPVVEDDLRALVAEIGRRVPEVPPIPVIHAVAQDDAQQAVQGMGVQVNKFGRPE